MTKPIEARLIRIERKLEMLGTYMGLHFTNYWDGPPILKRAPTPEEQLRSLIRIESKLQSLMLYEGLDPYERVERKAATFDE